MTSLILPAIRAATVWMANAALDKAEARLYAVNGFSDDIIVLGVTGAKAIKSIPAGRVPYGPVVVE